MRILYERVGGLDIHKKSVMGCRMRVNEQGGMEWEIKSFGTTTKELLHLLDWLGEWGCEQVALESTGEYWKPVYNLLEGNVEVWLVNARHVKKVPGRKSDASDAQWLAELMLHGLLKASFIPPKPQRVLRELTRYRSTVVKERARIVNRVQKGLESANIKLGNVVSDVMGVSAKAMLQEIAQGSDDAQALAGLAKGRLRTKLAELEQALTGLVDPHHRFILAQQLAHIDFLDQQIERLSQEIAQHLQQMSQPPADPPATPGQNDEQTPSVSSLPQHLTWANAVHLLDTIPGVDVRTAEVILAEIGLDMSQFPSADDLTAWAGLAPGSYESGGKRYSGRTTKGNKPLRAIMSQAAWAASRTKGTYLKARYHRLAARRGKKRAIVATARAMLVSVWHMLSRGEPYLDLGPDYFDQRKKESKVAYLSKQLANLGFSVTLDPHPVPA